MILGIDVSENNSYIPWDELEAEGVKFCCVRCSYGKHGRDENFKANVDTAHAHGMLVGAYHYDYSLSVEDARENAENCRAAIDEAGVLLELPVFYDMEDADHWKENHEFPRDPATIPDPDDPDAEDPGWAPDPGTVSSMCAVFGETIGLNWGVYASYSWLSDVIDWKGLGCPIWNAEWGPHDDIQGYVWQWTDNYNGYNIDGNYMYDENLFVNQE